VTDSGTSQFHFTYCEPAGSNLQQDDLLATNSDLLELRFFQAKLGWLVGNMYSRVGTVDWVPDHLTEPQFKAKVSQILDDPVQWVDENQLKAAKKTSPGDTPTRKKLRAHVNGTKAPTRKERLLDAVLKIVCQQVAGVDDKALKKLRQRLENDPQVSAALK
jgi:hypothetical protein